MRTLSRVLIYSLNQVKFRLDARISAILPKQQQKLAFLFIFDLDTTMVWYVLIFERIL